MIQHRETLRSAQQVFCHTAIYCCNDVINLLTRVQRIDGRDPKGCYTIANHLVEIEDQLNVAKAQIHYIRNLYER